MRRIWWWVGGVILIAAIAAVAYVWPRGVLVVIRNTGAAPMRDVRVLVTARSYPLGDIPPGASRSVHVDPDGESHLVVRFTDATGKLQDANVGGYFESSYAGSITVDIADGVVIKVQDLSRPGW